jgi:Leucine-rich repeat (LRR) protein
MFQIKKTLLSVLATLAIFVSANAQLLPAEALDTMPTFKNLEEALKNKDAVFKLDLSKQKLSEIPPEVFELKNINELYLDKNRLTVIPEQISELKYLQKFSAQHNEIAEIPGGLLKLTDLYYIDLADNIIETIPNDIDLLNKLETLSLWDNPIAQYPATLGDLTSLKVLDLLHNDISGETQSNLKSMLPSCKIIMSPPCACADGGE